MKKVKTFGVAAAVVVTAFKFAAAAEPPAGVPCPVPAEVAGKTLTHDAKVDLGRRVLTRCEAFSEQARYMSLHGYFAWLIEQSAEKLDSKNIRDLRDGAQGAFKAAAPDWKKEKVSKTSSGVYHGDQAILTYRFAAAEAKKMGSGRAPEPVAAPAPSAPRPAPPAAAPRPQLHSAPPPPPVLTAAQTQDYLFAPYQWMKAFFNKPSILLDWIPGVLP